MRYSYGLIGLAGFVLMGGCAHRQTNPAEVDQLNRQVASLRVQNEAYAKQLEELENRLFILNDRIESRKVNDEKVATPTLPTVTLHPAVAGAPTAEMASTETETASESEVEYAGDAAKPAAHRPILRMHGDAAEVSLSREASSPVPSVHVLREGVGHVPRNDSSAAVASYRRSYEALRAGKHEEAMQGFREFLHLFSNHDLADNAQYWLGECYYDRKDYASAVREFRRVIERYPSGNKVPDALLKVGYSYLALGSLEAGRQTLGQLLRSYPRHEAAGLAATRLAELDRSLGVRAASEPSAAAAPAIKTAHYPEETP